MRISIRSGSILLGLILGLLVLFWFRGYSGFSESFPALERSPGLISFPKIHLKPSYLDGLAIRSEEQADEFAFGVMIDNALAARSGQVGLDEAPLVLEALAEGGVTRFLAIFSSRQNLAKIGPVRSARSYFFDFFSPFHGLYVHAGGSDTALAELATQNEVLDVDHGRFGDLTFWRDQGLARPHNLFTSTELLTKVFSSASDAEGLTQLMRPVFPFSSKPEVGSDLTGFSIDFPGSGYDSSWTWNEVQKIFKRNAENSHLNISARNVVIMEMPTWAVPADEKGRLEMRTNGSGRMLLFQNGQQIEGVWRKETRAAALSFLSESGDVLPFLPGRTWIVMVDTLDRFSAAGTDASSSLGAET